jgi:hypothetical protein
MTTIMRRFQRDFPISTKVQVKLSVGSKVYEGAVTAYGKDENAPYAEVQCTCCGTVLGGFDRAQLVKP